MYDTMDAITQEQLNQVRQKLETLKLQMYMSEQNRKMMESINVSKIVYPNSCALLFNSLDTRNACNCSEVIKQKEQSMYDIYIELDMLFYPVNPIREWGKKRIEEIENRHNEIQKRYGKMLYLKKIQTGGEEHYNGIERNRKNKYKFFASIISKILKQIQGSA